MKKAKFQLTEIKIESFTTAKSAIKGGGTDDLAPPTTTYGDPLCSIKGGCESYVFRCD